MTREELLALLPRDALAIRRKFLRMHFEAQSGHLGSGLSDIDVLAYLYRVWLGPSDRFILSKGHGASSLYATLHHFGHLTDAELGTYYKDDTLLPAHPAPNGVSAITAATGSLGHGLPIATGMAYSFKKLQQTASRVACLLSDGECNEGATWEAALFGGHHGLDNLTVVVDANGIQGFGRTEDVLSLEPFAQKWAAFGFDVSECGGHDFAALHAAFSAPTSGRPRCIIARTVKGKGVSFMEDTVAWHYWPMSETDFADALAELGRAESELPSMRVDFVKAVDAVMARHTAELFITGDLGFNALESIAAKYGERFINAGVAEQSMMGLAAGTALTGMRPWVYSIAPFATYRCLEQIRNDVCLHNLPVRIAGNGGGYTYGIMGSTHHALEDLAVLKVLPNMQLFFPCANDHVAASVALMAELPGPAYIRLSVSAYATDLRASFEHPITLTRTYAKRDPARPGVTVIGAGHGVQVALRALTAHGLNQTNVDVFGVARFPFQLSEDRELLSSALATRNVVLVEEHYAAGGMGESMKLALPPLDSFALMSATYSLGQRYGSAAFHMQQSNLTPEALVAAVRAQVPS